MARLIIALGPLAAALTGGPVPAAERPCPPGLEELADPAALLQRFFGETTEEERQALAQVPVSPQEERRLGGLAVEAYLAHLRRQRIRVLRRGRDVQYLSRLAETIRPMMANHPRYPAVTVYLAESPLLEARAFPGGTIVFFRGLLEAAESEAALVSVVAHELSHIDRGHLLADLRRVKQAQQTFARGPRRRLTFTEFFDVGTLLMRRWTRPFRPEDEAEADRDAVRWTYAAGYDPRQMALLFQRYQQRSRLAAVPLPAFFRSHPPPADRIEAVDAEFRRLQLQDPKERLYVGNENFRRRIVRHVRQFPEERVRINATADQGRKGH